MNRQSQNKTNKVHSPLTLKPNGDRLLTGFTPLQFHRHCFEYICHQAIRLWRRAPFGSRFSNSYGVKRIVTGFTIIEVITAIFLLTVGVIGIFSVVNQAIVASQMLTGRLIAAYLAQEGIEVVRNIRDSNWIAAAPWDQGIETGERQADYQSSSLPLFNDANLNIESANGFYGYGLGTATQFKRKINITKLDSPSRIVVTVLVSWSERGRTHSFTTQETLYNWR